MCGPCGTERWLLQLHVVAAPSVTLPFQVEDVSRPKEYYERVSYGHAVIAVYADGYSTAGECPVCSSRRADAAGQPCP